MAIATVLAIFALLLISSVEAGTSGESLSPLVKDSEANRANGSEGDIAIDDFSVTPGDCSSDECSLPVPHVSIPTANCTFEDSDVCGFSQDSTDTFDWKRHQESTPSFGTGPQHDHTFEEFAGYYMYIEATEPSPNEVARLNSYILTGPITPTCVTFWYHMYGSGIGTLNVYVMRNGSRGSPIWTLSGNQGNSWNVANVSLATVSSNTSYQIVFDANTTNDACGDIAIDDFSVTEGSCSQNQPTVADMCTFDNNVCGFSQDNSDDFDWTRNKFSTPTTNTGPEYDHTLGQAVVGNYMYLKITPGSLNDVGRLNSNNLTGPITPTCVTFWYHMYGSDIGTLNVYVLRNGSRGSPIWTLSGNQGNSWNIANVTLNAVPCDTPYQIVFEAIHAIGLKGDIAIDDFSVTPDVISEWTEWADNGTCSTTCGRGLKMQERTWNCTNSTYCPTNFTPCETRTVDCEICTCPVISEWTEWADNGTCSTTCGRGLKLQERTRNCTNSTCCPTNFTSSETRTVDCEMCTCPEIGPWCPWADSDRCSVTCGGGTKMQARTRECTNTCTPPDCVKREERTVSCNCYYPCPSTWNRWSGSGRRNGNRPYGGWRRRSRMKRRRTRMKWPRRWARKPSLWHG